MLSTHFRPTSVVTRWTHNLEIGDLSPTSVGLDYLDLFVFLFFSSLFFLFFHNIFLFFSNFKILIFFLWIFVSEKCFVTCFSAKLCLQNLVNVAYPIVVDYVDFLPCSKSYLL
uniref:Uncharacterized protein n=1 Tax=Cacopsylla melanoneura TaxID=428564 RepID=A0A8D9EAR9_9HEMI